jgi:hypothetical protein
MLPTVAAAVGVVDADAVEPEPERGEGVFALVAAAAEAADTTGTEVSRTNVAGGDLGPRGRWVLLRHRRRHAIPAVGSVETDATAGLAPTDAAASSSAAEK